MAGKFNSKNRRLAKLRSKGSWFKGRQEVDPPEIQTMEAGEENSKRMEGAQEDGKVGIDTPENTEDSNRTEDMVSKVGKKANSQLSKNHGVGKESSRRKETGSPRKGVKGNKRGLNREIITLGEHKNMKHP